MERLSGTKSGRNRRQRIAMAAAVAVAAGSGLAYAGPPRIAVEDMMHHAFGRMTTVERTIERIAADKYHTTVFAHCAPIGGRTTGLASPTYGTIRLRPSVCDTLGAIIANPWDPAVGDERAALDVFVVAHEMGHVANRVDDEGVAQCLGAQRTQEIAEALGVSEERAKVLGDLAAAAASAPPGPDYAVPAGCVDGGPYDINAPGDHFPQHPVDAFIKGK